MIVRSLRAAGFRIWHDVDGIELRDLAERRIAGALNRSFAVLLAWSQWSASSAWVDAEIAFARSRAVTILIVRLDDTPIVHAPPADGHFEWPDDDLRLLRALARSERRFLHSASGR